MAKKTTLPTPEFSPEQLQATEEQALAVVSALGADEQADLVDAWITTGNVAAVASLARQENAPVAARKAARRGVNILKSRGVTIPEKNTVARPFVQATKAQYEAWFAPFDVNAQGSVLTILKRFTGKDCEFTEILFNNAVGISRVGGGRASYSRLREQETARFQYRGYDSILVPIEWARWRIAQARQQNSRSGLLLPLELSRYADLLSPVPATEPKHPATQLGLEASADEARVMRSFQLFREPEFRAFMLPQQVIQEMLQAVGQRIAALGRQPEQHEVEQFLDAEKLAGTDRFFQEEIRQQLAVQLWDVLLSIHHRLGSERALDLLATREAILTAGLITQPPREIPFLVGFFDKALAMLASENENGQITIPIPRPTENAGPVLSQEQLAAIEAVRQNPESA